MVKKLFFFDYFFVVMRVWEEGDIMIYFDVIYLGCG